MSKSKSLAKKIVFRKANSKHVLKARRKKLKKFSKKYFNQKYGAILNTFAWHMRRLGLTIQKVAKKMNRTVESLQRLARNPIDLDLQTITHMESIVLRDLIVTPTYSDGYFHTANSKTIANVDNYMFCTGYTRIFGTPKPDLIRFKALWAALLEAKRAKQAEQAK